MRAYIKPGHGEDGDPGAVCGQFIERDMAKIYGNALDERLTDAGWETKVKRDGMSISEAAADANDFKADIVLSCHINAGGGDRGEVIYSVRDGSENLANVVCEGLKAAGQTVTRTYTKLNSRGTDYYGILRLTECPAVIIEPFFLDNLIDREIGDTEEELRQLGYCIADALIDNYGGEVMVRYQKLSDIPNEFGLRDVVETLMNAKIICGDGSDPAGNDDVIDLSHDQVRSLVFEYRGGAFDRKLIAMGLPPAVEG